MTDALLTRAPRNTGPIELRDFGPNGLRLGTPDDCYDGSPWELHRGELIEQMGSNDIHGIVMAILAALFRTHARPGLTVMSDVYCDLSDEEGPSLRAPDVVIVSDLSQPKNEAYHGTPVLAVEIRGTQSKRYLEEKVELYLDHDWPRVWMVHAERREVEVLRKGQASVVYRKGTEIPLLPELDREGLRALPIAALFDDAEASRFINGWVGARARAQSILQVLATRKLSADDALRARVLACTDGATLDRWLALAVTCTSIEAFAQALG
jgi:Uma2 family endonuclease